MVSWRINSTKLLNNIKLNKMNKTKKQKENKSCTIHGVMWRFSIVLLIPITLILMVTVMPIRWLLTGKYRWKQKEFPLLYNWGRKCGF